MIGIFDSGIGGLTVLRALQDALPHHPMVYLADFGYCPYGSRSESEILARSQTILKWMKTQGVSVIVVACHTSSAVLTPQVIESIGLPTVTMLEPTVNSLMQHPDVGLWRNGVGILATALSVQKGTLVTTLREKGFPWPIYPIACPDLAPLIESCQWDQAALYLKHQAFFMLQSRAVPAVIYGCTHYPKIEPWIHHMPECPKTRIDPAHTVALTVSRLLGERAPEDKAFTTRPLLAPYIRFYHTADAQEEGQIRLEAHWPRIISQALSLNPASVQMA